MPNYCANSVTIEGENLDTILPNPFTFNGVLPRPKEMEQAGWYEWDCMNWGTKWDLCNGKGDEVKLEMEPGTGSVTFSFDTAWSPPIVLFCNLVKMHPELKVTLSYMEPGMCFAGYTVITKDGAKDYSVSNFSFRKRPIEQLDAIAKAHPPLDWIMEDIQNWIENEDEDEEEEEEEEETPDEMEVVEDEDVEPLDDFLVKSAFRNAWSTTSMNDGFARATRPFEGVPKGLALALRHTGPGYVLTYTTSDETVSGVMTTLDGVEVMKVQGKKPKKVGLAG